MAFDQSVSVLFVTLYQVFTSLVNLLGFCQKTVYVLAVTGNSVVCIIFKLMNSYQCFPRCSDLLTFDLLFCKSSFITSCLL